MSMTTHEDVAYAVEFLVNTVFHATAVVAARIGKGINTFRKYTGAIANTLLCWKTSFDNISSAEMQTADDFHSKDIFGTNWQQRNIAR